jgi:hypothetical protein
MAQEGQFLEILMANLQAYLGPEGVSIKLRERFYGSETGKQIGEIDVTVRGEFGISKFASELSVGTGPQTTARPALDP